MAGMLINAVKDIADKRYLELGVCLGQTFKGIQAKDKTSVDTEHPATYQGTTDNFFASLSPDDKWDVIYIDACHDYLHVLRDFNNSIDHLNSDGLIFMHDLIPPDSRHASLHYCGTAFRFLYYVIINCPNEYNYYSLATEYGDYGFSVFIDPKKKASPSSEITSVDYGEFIKNYSLIKTCSVDEMKNVLRSLV